MTLLPNHFYPGFFFLEGGGGGGGKLLGNCYYKFLVEVAAGYGLLTSQSF